MQLDRKEFSSSGLGDKVRVFVHDTLMAGASLVLALYLRVGSEILSGYGGLLVLAVPLFMIISGSMFLLLGMYRGVWKYTSTADTVALGKAVTLSIIVFMALLFFFDPQERLPRSVPLIQWFVLAAMVGGPRLSYRMLKSRAPTILPALARLRWTLRPPAAAAAAGAPADSRTDMLLVGVCDRAALFIRAMRDGAIDTPFRPVGILADDPAHRGRSVHGVPVLGTADDLGPVLRRLEARGQRPRHIVLTDPQAPASNSRLARLLAEADIAGIAVLHLGRLMELQTDGESETGTAREAASGPIDPAALLGRQQIQLDHTAIAELVAGRCVLVTGAGGSIGGELTRQIAALGPSRLLISDASEFNLYSIDLKIGDIWPDLPRSAILLDVRERERIEQVFAKHKPELVFHAAALKHVPMVEGHPCEGVLTNVMGTQHMAEAACRHGALAMVLISSDKAVNPTSMMGATKRLAEFYCQALDFEGRSPGKRSMPRFITVRFGNVLGSSGSVVPLFESQIARGGPVTVTHLDVRRYFMTIREAVELVLQASAHGVAHPHERGQIYVLDMGEQIKVADLAREMIRLHGMIPDVDIKLSFIGLRPGEKLYEELFDSEEERQESVTRGVLTACSQPRDLGLLQALYEALACAARRGDQLVVERLVTLVLPTYHAEGSLVPLAIAWQAPAAAAADETADTRPVPLLDGPRANHQPYPLNGRAG